MPEPMQILTDGEFHEEPPERVRAGGARPSAEWMTVAANLRKHPGQWRIVAQNAPPNLAGKIRRGEISAFLRGKDQLGQFDATARNVAGGRADIWARWDPEATQ